MNHYPAHTGRLSAALRTFSRRRMLGAAGVCIGLPWLESLDPKSIFASQAPVRPNRLAYLYIPNGVNVSRWRVQGEGAAYELSPTLAPLLSMRSEFSVVDGLNHENATPGPDGGGDHSRATATYLTGVRVKKTGGSDIRNGISIDQIIASQLGRYTRLPSLELSTDGARQTGRCDSGYSCAYQFNLSWASETRPVPAEREPRAVFERLFGSDRTEDISRESRKALRQSVLDFVRQDAAHLARSIGKDDQHRLDDYLSAVREVEKRIEDHEHTRPEGVIEPAIGIPQSYQDHIRLMFEMMILAFQSDATRVVTFVLAYDGSNRAFPEIGIPEAHHQLSHHRGDASKLEKIARIDRFYTEQFAWFLSRMKATSDGPNCLLDHAMLVYGGCLSEGNQHLHSDLPILVAGHGGGMLHPGKRLSLAQPTPMCNLHLALADRMGVQLNRFGDSTGRLTEL